MVYIPVYDRTRSIMGEIIKICNWYKVNKAKFKDKDTKAEYNERLKSARIVIRGNITDSISELQQYKKQVDMEIDFLRRIKQVADSNIENADVILSPYYGRG